MSDFLPYGSGGTGRWVVAAGSALIAHGLVLAAVLGGTERLWTAGPEEKPRPGFTITLQRLDADALRGVRELPADSSTTLATAQDPPDAPLPQDLQENTAAPEAMATEEPPEAPPPPAPAQEPAPDKTGEAAEETAVEPPPAEAPPPPPEPVVPVPVPPGTPVIAATPVAPASVSPILPEYGSGSAFPGDGALAPVSSAAIGAPSDLLSPSGTGHSLTTAPVVQAGPGATETAVSQVAASPQDLALSALIRRLRRTPADPCLIALPRRDGAEAVGLALIAAEDGAMTRFSEALLRTGDSTIRQTRALVDARQCPALDFLRALGDYPATRLGLSLQSDEVPSGGQLSGLINGVGGRYLLLLLIDNNGVVQDLQRFVTFAGNIAKFDVPVTRDGAARDTSQILLALVTDRPAAQIRARIDRLAQEVFAGDPGTALSGAAFALQTFDVR